MYSVHSHKAVDFMYALPHINPKILWKHVQATYKLLTVLVMHDGFQ